MNALDDHLGLGVLVGQNLSSVKEAGEAVVFTLTDGRRYKLYHESDCCESVDLEEVDGNLTDLHGLVTVAMSEEEAGESTHDDSCTITTIRIATETATVTMTWRGESNGYYRETPTFEEMNSCQK